MKDNLMKIIKIFGREIFDSRGFPTLECEITLSNGHSVIASVPSGASVGLHEAIELRDNDQKRLQGKGLLKSIDVIEHVIAPAFIGTIPQVCTMDKFMIDLDGTPDKSRLGANTILAVSIATLKAQAHVEEMELFECIAHLYNAETVMLPVPLFNMINGGAHADNNIRIQEFMVAPLGAKNFRNALEQASLVFYHLKRLLKEAGKVVSVGDEGGFAPCFEHEVEAIDFLLKAINEVGDQDMFRIALDVAASEFFNPEKRLYWWHGKEYTAHDMIALYKELLSYYPIFSIEDGIAQDDWDGWMELTRTLGETTQIVGDDLFVTSSSRIMHGIKTHAANAAIIKPNQIGTVTETLQAIQTCQEYGMGTIISHRSGETEDTFIADLAVGTSAGQIKAGSCSRGERMAKYNRLLRIEDQLINGLLES